MMIKFLNRGTGSAKAAMDYLLQTHDHNGEIRAKVQILRGRPNQITPLAESLLFKHKYRSGLIAWHKEDKPTKEQINKVLDDFEEIAFAGLETDQYAYYAVWHGESNGAGHIHIIIPRVELHSGRSFNIAPPGWHRIYDVIRDLHNTMHGWKSPDIHENPMNARLVHKPLYSLPKEVRAVKETLNQNALQKIKQGEISNAQEMKDWLNTQGEVTKHEKNTISLKINTFKHPIKLQGEIYKTDFSPQTLKPPTPPSTAEIQAKVQTLQQRYQEILSNQTQYNQQKYPATHTSTLP